MHNTGFTISVFIWVDNVINWCPQWGELCKRNCGIPLLLALVQHGFLRDCIEAWEQVKPHIFFLSHSKAVFCKVCNLSAFSEQREQVFFCRCNKKLTWLNMEKQTLFEKLVSCHFPESLVVWFQCSWRFLELLEVLVVNSVEWAGCWVSFGDAKLSDLVRTEQGVLWRAVSWSGH